MGMIACLHLICMTATCCHLEEITTQYLMANVFECFIFLVRMESCSDVIISKKGQVQPYRIFIEGCLRPLIQFPSVCPQICLTSYLISFKFNQTYIKLCICLKPELMKANDVQVAIMKRCYWL